MHRSTRLSCADACDLLRMCFRRLQAHRVAQQELLAVANAAQVAEAPAAPELILNQTIERKMIAL